MNHVFLSFLCFYCILINTYWVRIFRPFYSITSFSQTLEMKYKNFDLARTHEIAERTQLREISMQFCYVVYFLLWALLLWVMIFLYTRSLLPLFFPFSVVFQLLNFLFLWSILEFLHWCYL